MILDFPITSVLSGSDDKESSCSLGDPGSVPGLGRSPGEGKGNPHQYSCLGKSHGQRSLVVQKELDHKQCQESGYWDRRQTRAVYKILRAGKASWR